MGGGAKYGGQATHGRPAQAAASGSWCRVMATDPTPSASQPALGSGGMLGTTRGSTWSDHRARTAPAVASSEQGEAVPGGGGAGGCRAPWYRKR